MFERVIDNGFCERLTICLKGSGYLAKRGYDESTFTVCIAITFFFLFLRIQTQERAQYAHPVFSFLEKKKKKKYPDFYFLIILCDQMVLPGSAIKVWRIV